MLETFVRNTSNAWVTRTNRHKAFDKGLDVAGRLAPYIGGFLLDMEDGIVSADRTVNKVATLNCSCREVRGCSGCRQSSFENTGAVVTPGCCVASKTCGGVSFLEARANEAFTRLVLRLILSCFVRLTLYT